MAEEKMYRMECGQKVGIIMYGDDQKEAAHDFFAQLRAFDKSGVDVILAAAVDVYKRQDMNMAGVEESPQSYTRTPDADKLWQTAVLSFSAVMRLSWPTAMVSRLTGFPVFSESHLPKAAVSLLVSSSPRVTGDPSVANATPLMSLPFCRDL